MVITYFISALIALGVWNKATKKTEEKTKNASWMRCLFYAVLTICFSLFFLKTNEIATIRQTIDIHGYNGGYDIKKKRYDDSVSIIIYNRFNYREGYTFYQSFIL